MPDQDRGVVFLHTLNQDQEAEVRCPSCPGYRVTYQADCACCGRELLAYQDCKPNGSSITCKSGTAILPKTSAASFTQAAPAPDQTQAASKRPRTCQAGRQSPSPISVLRGVGGRLQRPSAFGRESGIIGSGRRLLLPAAPPAGSRSGSVRRWQHSTVHKPAAIRPSPTSSSSSSSRSSGAYIAAPRGSSRPPVRRVGAHQVYQGVRTRRGVRGFLVEIRPPKWKKTIWLGTYNTAVEAAGAFDAGVFYTNKPNTKYNFQVLEAAFPPLPSHLSLDRPDNMEEIKYFVQKEAKLAAATARRMCNSHVTSSSSGVTQPHHQELLQHEVKPAKLVLAFKADDVSSVNSTESESCEVTDLPSPDAEYDQDGFLEVIPMDLDYFRGSLPAVDEDTAENWIAEYTNYVSNTQPAQGPGFQDR